MKTLILNQTRARVPKAWLERWLKGLSRALRRPHGRQVRGKEIVVVFVTGPEMRRLNRFYRKKDRATDVLSFASGDPTSLGEIVLCQTVIRAQSRRTGLTERGELGYMIVHGVLHLLGHDHERPADERRMFALQDRIFADLLRTVGLR